MAVYNGETHLREAIDSILRQSFDDYEFIIVNDGSTDGTREIILSYDDRRIRWLDNERRLGLTPSLNRGLAMAEGEFIARQDADDVSEPERLARQAAFLEANSSIALLGTWYKKIDDAGNELGARDLPCSWMEIRWALLFFCPLVHSSVMLRRTALQRSTALYDESFVHAQDFELWSRIASRLPVANLPKYLLRLRISSASMTSTYGDVVRNEFLRVSTANLAFLIGVEQARKLVHNDAEFANMTALMFGDYRHLNAPEAIAAWEQIDGLLKAFCRAGKKDADDCRMLSAALRARVARRFVEIGHRHIGEGSDSVELLLSSACRLHWARLFARRSLGLGLKLLRRRLWGSPTAAAPHGEKS